MSFEPFKREAWHSELSPMPGHLCVVPDPDGDIRMTEGGIALPETEPGAQAILHAIVIACAPTVDLEGEIPMPVRQYDKVGLVQGEYQKDWFRGHPIWSAEIRDVRYTYHEPVDKAPED